MWVCLPERLVRTATFLGRNQHLCLNYGNSLFLVLLICDDFYLSLPGDYVCRSTHTCVQVYGGYMATLGIISQDCPLRSTLLFSSTQSSFLLFLWNLARFWMHTVFITSPHLPHPAHPVPPMIISLCLLRWGLLLVCSCPDCEPEELLCLYFPPNFIWPCH